MPHRVLATALPTLLCALALGCGAKTGLLVPDIGPPTDAALEDTFVRFDSCVAGRFTMQRRRAELLLVIDRSGSMSTPLDRDDGGVTSRWDAMRRAIAATIPPIEDSVAIGAIFYPRTPLSGTPISLQACTTRTILDVPAERRTSNPILYALNNSVPNGATPTYDALGVAGTALGAVSDRSVARYIVLATDGGPNCNIGLPVESCTCLDGSPPCGAFQDEARFVCLDDVRTVQRVADLTSAGIATFVIGIRDASEPRLADVLNRMAVAGGRPNLQGGDSFYDVRRQQDLIDALQGIVRTVAQCAYVTPSRPDDPDAITVSVAGQPVSRDTTHQNGWDWTDAGYGEVTLFGPACSAVLASEAPLEATVMCR